MTQSFTGSVDATLGAAEDGYTNKVPAVDQANRILFFLAERQGEAPTLSEICRGLGIHKSKGLALLNTQRAAGLVSRDDRTKTYTLGASLLVLSRAMLEQSDFTRVVEPFLDRLVQRRGTTAFLGLVWGNRVTVVARRDSPAGTGTTVRLLGYRWYPLTWGAVGKAILSSLTPDEQDDVLARPPHFFYGDSSITPLDLPALRAELAEAERKGYATDIGGVQEGVNAVSAPVFGVRRNVVRPIGCIALVGGFSAGEADSLGALVAATANELTQEAGPLLDGIG
ncbi:MAG: IclR family transcriptional regulator [Thermoleophilia bacterium]